MLRVFVSPAYTMAATDWDTTRKAGWVGDSLRARPIPGVELVAPEPLTPEQLADAHDPAYITAVQSGAPRDLAASNGIGWDSDLFPSVAASSGGAVAAALHALSTGTNAGSLSSGLHHARADRGNGFCTFNGLALAARAALAAGASRVLIVDIDAHCGGGTHAILGGDPAIHQVDVATDRFDRYQPIEPWTLDLVDDAADYLPTIRGRLDALDQAGLAFDLVLDNAGMDPWERCRIGGLAGVDEAMLAERERLVFDWAAARATPVAFVLAGGYATGDAERAQLVDLHRETIRAAAR